MRPTISFCWASACSWVIFSFFTRPPSWPCVTCWAFSRPWSTNFCSTSLSTTSRPAAAITWAISPPIVPAPTTAALNTYIGPPKRLLGLVRLQARLFRRFGGEAPARPAQGVADGAADEEEVGERGKHPRAGEPVVERQLEDGATAVVELEAGALDAVQPLLEDLGLEAVRRVAPHDLLRHPAA